MNRKKIGLALEGGGAKGAYEIGAYVALKELGYKFDMVVGTSIGALNAALIVQGDIKLAKRLWLNANSEIIGLDNKLIGILKNFKISKENIKYSFDEINKIIKNNGLDVSIYKNMIDEYIDERKLRNSNIEYGLVTLRLNDFKPLEVTLKDIEFGKLSEYILASSYLPIFKMDKIIDGSYYFDGGVINNLPITLLQKNGCEKIYAIRINGIGNVNKKIFSNTDTYIIEPTKDTGSMVFFDNDDIKNNYNMGYYDTLLYFNKVDGFKYYFKKFIFYNLLIRKVNKNIINLIKLKYRVNDTKSCVIKSIEEILEDNNIDYYKIYSIYKMLKYIKKNRLKSKNNLVNEFVYQL